MLPSDHGHPWANRLVQLPPPLLSAIRATPDGPRKVVTLVRYYAMEYGGAMKDILTAEDEKYLAQHAHSGMTRKTDHAETPEGETARRLGKGS